MRFLLFIILFACSNFALAQSYHFDRDGLHWYEMPVGRQFGTQAPCAMRETKMYAFPSDTSHVLREFKPGMHLNVYHWSVDLDTHFQIKDFKQHQSAIEWVEQNHLEKMWFYIVDHPTEGFVMARDVAESCKSTVGNSYMFTDKRNRPRVYRFNDSLNTFSDSLEIPIDRIDHVRYIWEVNWKNVEYISSVEYVDLDRSAGGITQKVYLAHTNNGVQFVYKNSFPKLDSTTVKSSVYNVYFAAEFVYEKQLGFRLFKKYFNLNIRGMQTKYLANGMRKLRKPFNLIFNLSYPFPQKLWVRKRNRFIVVEDIAVFETDRKGNLVYDEYGRQVVKKNKTKIHHYRWTDKGLKKLWY